MEISVMASLRPVLAVGFGHYFRERLLTGLFEAGYTPDIRVATSLVDGQAEFDDVVAPFFARHGLACPKFIPDVADAATAVRGMGGWGAAVINTPPGLHHAQATACLEVGLDVYVEKPIVTQEDDLISLIEAAERAGVRLFTGSQRRMEAPFEYMRDVIANGVEFGQLARISCVLSVGERPIGWRTDRSLAGGGVLLDSGYHLLDCATWLASSAGHSFGPGSVRYAYFSRELVMNEGTDTLESTAFGHARSDGGVDLFFDVSYLTATASVFERLEVVDREGARVVVIRDQAVRGAQPGRVTHQRPDGSVVALQSADGVAALDRALLSHSAGNSRPLESFLKSRESPKERVNDHPCTGASAVASWLLVREIYRKASGDGHA